MTKETKGNPEKDAPEMDEAMDAENGNEAAIDFSPLAMMMAGGNNPKPDTAQGVADLLEQTRNHVERHSKIDLSFLHSDDGTSIPIVRKPGGGYDLLGPDKLDHFSANPTFRRGVATMTSLDSFIAHVNRFGDDDSAVFVRDDRSNPGLLAVLDYHRKDTLRCGDEDLDREGSTNHGEYRHGFHRVAFDFPVSDEWRAWTSQNGSEKVMTMTQFAEFLEDHVLDVAEIEDAIPENAKRFVEMGGGKKNIADWSALTKLAKSLSVYESAVVTEVSDLQGGSINLTIAESHDTEIEGIKATVPTMFFIAIPIFRDGTIYRLPIRLRYRKGRGSVMFFYEMWQSDRAFMDAVKDAVQKVGDETQAQTFYGSPEQAVRELSGF